MSRLSELMRQARKADPQLGADLEAEISALTKRRTFGLVFEQHQPEAVDLPGRPVRRGDKVRVLAPRGETKAGDQRLWRVTRIERTDEQRAAHLAELDTAEPDTQVVLVQDLVVVAEFRDRVYPGLVETGRVQRGGDKPFHSVINAENFHALEMLTYTHRHSIDAIYIDPPYNTGAKDWKYNNNYVEGDDDYRHSKWLAFMERRLKIARDLLNPNDSVLIVTIDEKEYLRLGLLLEQTFPEARIQMVTSVISSQGSTRGGAFSRSDEYLYFVMFGSAEVSKSTDDMLKEGQSATKSQLWFQFIRTGKGQIRSARPGLFYPLYIDPVQGVIREIGDVLPENQSISEVPDHPAGYPTIWPVRADGREGYWRVGPETARRRLDKGLLRLGRSTQSAIGWSPLTVNAGTEKRITSGEVVIDGQKADGSADLREVSGNELRSPKTVWNKVSHNAGWHGSKLVASLIPGVEFPYPKSLYAVEDALRFFAQKKPNAVILDFFAGSGTTAHAVMRLNKQDGGHRQCISVTNNEVSAEEQAHLRKRRLRPGDAGWEALGICDQITKPRISAAITGKTPRGDSIKGDYKFTDEFPISNGFEENAAYFTLTYEASLSVRHNRAFERIAPILWMRAGSRGRIINDLGTDGWDVAEAYAVLENLDQVDAFIARLKQTMGAELGFIVTDDDSAFQMVCRELPGTVTAVRLYESYLQNFQINTGRSL